VRRLASPRKLCDPARRMPQANVRDDAPRGDGMLSALSELSVEQGCSGHQHGACVMRKLNGPTWLAALCLLGGGAYAAAQPKPQAPAPKPEAAANTMCGHDCPMHQVIGRAEVKVEQTKQGAVIQLIAKRPEDVQSVQQGAAQLAAMLNGTTGCPMHQGMHSGHGGGMHQHQHKHAPPQPSPKP
jgi:hypothetical protein